MANTAVRNMLWKQGLIIVLIALTFPLVAFSEVSHGVILSESFFNVFLIPIILIIEIPIVAGMVKLPWHSCAWPVSLANCLSTLAGLLLAVAYDIIVAAQVSQWENIAYAARILGPVFFFCLTYEIERLFLKQRLEVDDVHKLNRSVLIANFVSCTVIIVAMFALF